jgi:hypothetical protein
MIRYHKLVQVFVIDIPRAAAVFKGGHSCDSVEVCIDIANNLAKCPTHNMTLFGLRERAIAR